LFVGDGHTHTETPIYSLFRDKLSLPRELVYQCRTYMDHDSSIKLGDGGRSEEKRPKIWEVRVGQRRRGAMLSVQSKAID
jgi:hypothetical protein